MPEAIAQTLGHAQSQKKRKLIKQGFGWVKAVHASAGQFVLSPGCVLNLSRAARNGIVPPWALPGPPKPIGELSVGRREHWGSAGLLRSLHCDRVLSLGLILCANASELA